MANGAGRDGGRNRQAGSGTGSDLSPNTAGCGLSSRGRATASSWRSHALLTPCHAHWNCSARRWRRSSYGSGFTPVTCNCATPATTSAPRSTRPPGCAISRTAARRCCRAPPRNWSPTICQATRGLSNWGSTRLRDLPRAERVQQLRPSGRRCRVPAAAGGDDAVKGRLPVHLTNFIGRRGELAELRDILTDNRLLTLTGAGGVGKTRLALQLATTTTAELRRRRLVR